MGANGHRRVVITGLGAVTPLGNDVRSSWENLVAGKATADPITAFDTTGFPVTFACEAKDFEPTQWIERKQARRMDRFAQMIVAAARQAQVGRRAEDRAGVRSGGRRLRDCDGRSQVVRGSVRDLGRARPHSGQPVLDHRDHSEHGRKPGLDRTRHEGPALLPVHRLRRLDDGDRRRAGRNPPRACGGDARRW